MKDPQKSKKSEQSPPAAQDRHPDLPQWLFDEADSLREMIKWWQSRESAAMEGSLIRPVFKGKTRNSGIRVNESILDRALKKARGDKLRTGGNLSQLVEWLMWIYIGSPIDVVERPPEGS